MRNQALANKMDWIEMLTETTSIYVKGHRIIKPNKIALYAPPELLTE